MERPIDVQDMARRWLYWDERHWPDGKADFDLFDDVDALVLDEPETALRLIDEMTRQAATDDALHSIAAGPLEELVLKHGTKILPLLVSSAEANPKLKRCLADVYPVGLPAPVVAELKRLAGK